MRKCTLSIEKGEAIFSLLLRYCRWTSINIEDVAGALAVHKKTILRDLPVGAHSYEAYTGSRFQHRSALLTEHSAAMYFSASISAVFRNEELRMCAARPTLLDSISIGTTWSHLRYCPSCAAAEFKTFRYSWWHRDHQLPLSVVCLHHERLLVHTPLDYRSNVLPHELPARSESRVLPGELHDDILAICRFENFLAATTSEGALHLHVNNQIALCSRLITDPYELEDQIELTVKNVLILLKDAGMREPAADWDHLRVRTIALTRNGPENCDPVIATLVATACRRLFHYRV